MQWFMNALKRCALLAIFLRAILTGSAVFGAGTSGLADAIQAELKRLTADATGGRERHDSYIQLAKMLRLSGDIEGAASAWENAVYADPEWRDDSALVESASCYVSMGDWDKADSIVKLVLLTVRDDKKISRRAAYLNGQIEAFRSGNTATLAAMVDSNEYSDFHPAIYYTLWQVSGNDEYRIKLLSKFPHSPEAYSADGGGQRVAAMPSANWLLFPGRGESRSEADGGAPAPIGRPTAIMVDARSDQQSAPIGGQAANPSNGKAASYQASPRNNVNVLQTGLYVNRKSALSQADRLRSAGFNAAVTRRTDGAQQSWAVSVLVPVDSTQRNTIQRLKEYGYNAFPAH
jgi:hypothetical protein